MTASLEHRLNQILPRITDEQFLSSKGIGHEIACYIFDYAPEAELEVRGHLQLILDRLESHHQSLRVLHLDLFSVVIDYLRHRKLFSKAVDKQVKEGDRALLKALQGLVTAEKIRDFIGQEYHPAESDLILLSGMGSVWPMLRAHSLLNCLHSIIGKAPLVMFYPGQFDGTTLNLFDRVSGDQRTPGAQSYYRAFPLLSGGFDS